MLPPPSATLTLLDERRAENGNVRKSTACCTPLRGIVRWQRCLWRSRAVQVSQRICKPSVLCMFGPSLCLITFQAYARARHSVADRCAAHVRAVPAAGAVRKRATLARTPLTGRLCLPMLCNILCSPPVCMLALQVANVALPQHASRGTRACVTPGRVRLQAALRPLHSTGDCSWWPRVRMMIVAAARHGQRVCGRSLCMPTVSSCSRHGSRKVGPASIRLGSGAAACL